MHTRRFPVPNAPALLTFALGVLLLMPSGAYGKEMFSTDYKQHDFDSSIKQVLGYDNGSVLYFSELSTITTDEKGIRNTFEPLGCYPFYFLKEGVRKEAGYDCQTFFCVGYFSGSQQCRDRDNKSYGGAVEIDNRVEAATKGSVDITFPFFTSFGSDLPAQWQDRTKHLLSLSCNPYFIAEWDVISGDGYKCTAAGHYIPTTESYSPAYDCRKMWKGAKSLLNEKYKYSDSDGYLCDSTISDHDFKIREYIIKNNIAGAQTPQDFLNEAKKVYSDAAARSSAAATSKSQSSVTATTSTFTDVKSGDYGSEEIIRLHEKGVIEGYDDGTYKPQRTVNRAELNKLLIAGLHPSEAKSEASCFPDVKQEWFSTYVCAAKRLGWVSGYPDGSFMPANTVNRAEAIKIVVSSLTQSFDSSASLPGDVDAGAWFAKYVRKAVELGIIVESQFRPSDSLTRAEIAIWIDRATR